MKREPTAAFDARAFLTKAGTGRSISAYRKKQVVFVQGDPADAVFYLERGQIKLTVVSPPQRPPACQAASGIEDASRSHDYLDSSAPRALGFRR
jgi:hypothetical protein